MTTAAWGSSAYRMCEKLLGRELTKEMQASNDLIVTKGNRTAMIDKFRETFGENGSGYDYIFYPLSGHGLLLDPVSEYKYDQTLFRYCETYFGY